MKTKILKHIDNKFKQSNTIQVLVVDDSALMRHLISDILKQDSQIDIIGHATNGKEAFLLAKKLQPDVILMDMTMGEYGGLYGVKRIMAECPTPIIILSALGNSNMEPIMTGLNMGAIDYLNKPAKNNVNMREVSDVLIKKVKVASKVVVAEETKKKEKKTFINVNEHSFDENSNYDIITIGSSTGGPTAVENIIIKLPKNLNIPVIVTQHMPANFIDSFAARLDKLTPLSVSVAKKGQILKKGEIVLSPGSKNMILGKKNNEIVIDFTEKKFPAYNHPSVDSVMLSVAKIYGRRAIGVILTGMGKDGAQGMKAIKDAGGYTIAQSKDSCVVYGMPRVAVENNAVVQIVKLDEIAGFLVSCLC